MILLLFIGNFLTIHGYNPTFLELLSSDLEKKYIAKLITTEKDSFRINPFFQKRFIVVPIEAKFQDEKNFKDTIEKFIK